MRKVRILYIYMLIFTSAGLNYAQTATLKPTLSLESYSSGNIAIQNNIPVPGFEKQLRLTLKLDGIWLKKRFRADHNLSLIDRTENVIQSLENEIGSAHLTGFDDSGWEEKVLPAVENTMYQYPAVPEYYEDGVIYRQKFFCDSSLEGLFTKLIFLAANYVADVWLNGNYIGYHEGGYTPFAFDVSNYINYGTDNTLAIRLDNPPWGSRKDIVPFYKCDWFNYTGLVGEVYLEFSSEVSVIRSDVVTLNRDGMISISSVLFNNDTAARELELITTVYKADINESNLGSENALDLVVTDSSPVLELSEQVIISASEVLKISYETLVPNVQLWSPASPELYILSVRLVESGDVIDEYATQFGIRTIETDGNKVRLNNEVVFFTGVARHEDHSLYGRSIPRDVILEDLKTIKNSNINFLRTGHYPNSPYTYLIADRLGITVMEEIPVWWFDNEEEWLIQNNERHIHEQMFREMVFKDFNRPSIILWSTSNECKEETNRLIYNQIIVDDIKNNYADGRLISQSSAGDNPGHADITQSPLDVAGWTLYFGIFHGPWGSPYFSGTVNFIIQAMAAFPGKPIIDTEFGYWSSENGSSAETQIEVFNETFKAFKFFSPIKSNGTFNNSGSIMAVTWWCMFDWYSHQHPDGFQSMGLISMDRTVKKPVYDVLVEAYKPYYDLGGTIVTSVNYEDAGRHMLAEYTLMQNYPNPFNGTTIINFSLPGENNITVKLFDTKGELVKILADGSYNSGRHSISLSTSGLSSGIYICSLEAKSGKNIPGYYSAIKLTLLK